jgi:predicted DNA-binding protein (MmcQ/YjbR family)
MDNERIREICLRLPHAVETLNWGHRLVYWVGDRELGGKMFATTDVDGVGTGVLWFHAGSERFHELLEIEGIIPAPYMARAHWVTLLRWNVLRPQEIEQELARAHTLIYEKLPKRVKNLLALPEKERKHQLGAHKQQASVKKPAKKAAKPRNRSGRKTV